MINIKDFGDQVLKVLSKLSPAELRKHGLYDCSVLQDKGSEADVEALGDNSFFDKYSS